MLKHDFVCDCGYKEIDSCDKDFWSCPECKKIWKVERYGGGDVFIQERGS